MVARIAYLVKQIQEKIVTIGKYFHLVVFVRESQTKVGKEVDKFFVGVGQLQFALLGIFKHAPFGESVHASLTD